MKILVGAGSDAPSWSESGWTCNDVESAAALHPGITLVGPCWQIPVEDESVDEVMAKGMFEHLTYAEGVKSLVEWKRILRPGGFVTIEVPDVEEYIREYLKMRADPSQSVGEGHDGGAEGEPDDREACIGPDRWLRRALYGWQRWPGDEHRSGWTEKLFAFYLGKYFSTRFEIRRSAVSFDEDLPHGTYCRVKHLWGRAWKE